MKTLGPRWNVLLVAAGLLAAAGAGLATSGQDEIYVEGSVRTPLGEVQGGDVTLVPYKVEDVTDLGNDAVNGTAGNDTARVERHGDDAALYTLALQDVPVALPGGGLLWAADSLLTGTFDWGVNSRAPWQSTLVSDANPSPGPIESTGHLAGFTAQLGVGVAAQGRVGKYSENPDIQWVNEPGLLTSAAYSPLVFTHATHVGREVAIIPRDASYGPVTYDRYFLLPAPAAASPASSAGPEAQTGILTPQSAPAGTGFPLLSTPAAVVAATAALGLLLLAPWLLYHRIKGHKTLENNARKRIYDAILEKPGLGVQEVADVAGVSYSTASYHLDRLVKARMIVVSDTGGRLRHYKNGGSLSEAERTLIPLLKSPEAMRVLEAVLETPGTYRAELAQRLGTSVTTLNWHLKRLLAADLVSEVREGRSARLYATRETLRARMAPLAEKVPDGTEEAAALTRVVGAPAQPLAAA